MSSLNAKLKKEKKKNVRRQPGVSKVQMRQQKFNTFLLAVLTHHGLVDKSERVESLTNTLAALSDAINRNARAIRVLTNNL